MTQTGSGALNERDIQILRQAPVILLHDDDKGRAVVYFEETRVDPDFYDRMGFVSLSARCRFFR